MKEHKNVRDFLSFMTGDQQLLASSAGIVRNVSVTDLGGMPQTGGRGGRPPQQQQRQRVALVMDGEQCLDRLYGGYFPNWVCGGEWRHMMTFLANLFGRLHQSNVQVVVFLNGALEPARFKDWTKQQKDFKAKSKNVMRHLAARGTPPPKAFWVPPCALHTMLRLALRALNVTVINSHEDHRLEIMGFCWENGYHGVMSDDGEFALFNPPRYFSAHSLKLSLHFDVTTTEYGVDEVAKALDLNPNRFSLLASLLGNHILPSYELAEFHNRVAPPTSTTSATADSGDKPQQKDQKTASSQQHHPNSFDRVIKAVINYIRALPSVDDYDVIAKDVFGTDGSDPRVSCLKESVKYYLQGTKEGYSKHFANNQSAGGGGQGTGDKVNKKSKAKTAESASASGAEAKLVGRVITDGAIRLPAEQQAEEQQRRQQIKQQRKSSTAAEGGKRSQAEIAERIALDLERLDLDGVVARAAGDYNNGDDEVNGDIDDAADAEDENGAGNNGSGASDGDEDQKDNSMSVVQALAQGVGVAPSEDGKYPDKTTAEGGNEGDSGEVRPICIPEPQHEVKKTAAERHRLGQMSPYVNQVLNKGEIKLPVLLEGENFSQLPPAHDVFRPLRQNIYAVLFNLHHARYTKKSMEDGAKKCNKEAQALRNTAEATEDEDEKQKLLDKADKLTKQAAEVASKFPSSKTNIDFTVREWHPYNGYEKPKCVEAQELRWAVPTVQRLWFGSTVEDKQKRLHAFMSIMRCDSAAGALLLHASVPQPMLLMACVLRYIITSSLGVGGQPIIRKPELDAFLVTAFSPELRDDAFLDDLTLENVTMRGVRLSVLFMQGIEMAMFANDACGAPIPFQMCLPWHFFDGKLFHTNLARVSKARNVLDLCGGRIDIVHQVERMRTAIMEGLVGPGGGQQQAGYGQAMSGRMSAISAAVQPAAGNRSLYNHRQNGNGAFGGGQQKNKNRGGKKNKKNKNKDGKQQQHSDKQLPSDEMDGGDKATGEMPEVDGAPAIEYPRAEE